MNSLCAAVFCSVTRKKFRFFVVTILTTGGPRPLLPEYNIFFTTEELRRFNVKPGLIPPDSVDESPIISWTKQFEYECTYADNVCLKSDLNIILKTFKMLFARKKSHYGEFVRTPLNVEREKA